MQILTHSDQFFDILLLKNNKMLKKLLNTLIKPKVTDIIDGKTWIQKILLEEKFGKINS